MTVYETYSLLKYAGTMVARQSEPSWELFIVADGPSKQEEAIAKETIRQIKKMTPKNQIHWLPLPRAKNCFGNVGRHAPLSLAAGKYVCWVNHDNVIAVDYLKVHRENFDRQSECISVVDIDLWVGNKYHGCYPRAFQRSKIDLLCFAVPTKTAIEVDAFGRKADSKIYRCRLERL